jgi:flagellar L-ring protein precursor FlgH
MPFAMKQFLSSFLSPFLLLIALGGCSSVPSSIVQQPPAVRAPVAAPVVASNGAIFQGSTYRPFFEDRRARQVGDLITIVITETTNAVKAGTSSGNKSGSVAFSPPIFLQGRLGGGLASSSGSQFADGDNQSASNAFTGTIGVSVLDVLPNGNLIVSGEKQIAMNKGVEFIRFSGMINPDTILPGNRVSSTQVADARVEYRTNSQIDRAEMTAMVSRFFQSLLPF